MDRYHKKLYKLKLSTKATRKSHTSAQKSYTPTQKSPICIGIQSIQSTASVSSPAVQIGPEEKYFDEKFYLNFYPDVMTAVRKKKFKSGYEHYQIWGKNENRHTKFITKNEYISRKYETIVMTATFNPLIGIPYLTLNDECIRLIQYLYSIIFWSSNEAVGDIIICENSNTNYDFTMISDFVSSKDRKLEVLIFKSDHDPTLGKGYGEGQIMEHVFTNSKLLSEREVFYKITGRVCVHNFVDLSLTHNISDNVFKPNWMDVTRFFKVSRKIFEKHLLYAYKDVNERHRINIENVYLRKLSDFEYDRFQTEPIIVGQAGGSGWRYHKTYNKDILSMAISFMPESKLKEEFIKFDNEYYLSLYPDVASAVDNNLYDSGLVHYIMHGYKEKRSIKIR